MKKKGIDVTVLSPGPTATPMLEGVGDMDMSKTPMVTMEPSDVARLGLNGLGKKPLVIPGGKNNMMLFVATHFATHASAIKMGGEMMEKAMTAPLQ